MRIWLLDWNSLKHTGISLEWVESFLHMITCAKIICDNSQGQYTDNIIWLTINDWLIVIIDESSRHSLGDHAQPTYEMTRPVSRPSRTVSQLYWVKF